MSVCRASAAASLLPALEEVASQAKFASTSGRCFVHVRRKAALAGRFFDQLHPLLLLLSHAENHLGPAIEADVAVLRADH